MNDTERLQKIHDILNRGVEDIFVKENLEKRLLSGEKLRVKLGIDPTSPNIHIGRAIPLRKLRDFQDLGHRAVFIVGDFTALVGDPSDKLSKRPMLTEKQVEENLKAYKKQVGKIIDLKKAEFHYNSKWLAKLKFAEITELAETFSVQQMIARRNFKDRFEKGEEISLREFLYPLMQGYDSVMVKADVEIGGFDQLFNLKAGRTIQKHHGQKEQDVLTTKMLDGTDGRKMSSSWGNVIAINDTPENMYGKIMSIKDDLIEKYFMLCTDLSENDIVAISDGIKRGDNPKHAKMRLAREIVTFYHDKKSAQKAEEVFTDTFSNHKAPEDVQEVSLSGQEQFSEALLKAKVIGSKGEWRRLVDEGAISIVETGEKIRDPFYIPQKGTILRVGKRRFVKVV